MADKPLPDIMTASLMFASLDMDGDGEVTRSFLNLTLNDRSYNTDPCVLANLDRNIP